MRQTRPRLRARLRWALSHARSKWLCVIHTVFLRNLAVGPAGGAEYDIGAGGGDIDFVKRSLLELVLMEYRVSPTGQRDRATYGYLYRRELRVVAIERFRLKTDYHDVAARVARLCSHPHLVGHTTVIYEMNGPGQVVHELLQRAKLEVTLLPVTTSGGQVATVKGARRTVPKAKLVASLETLFQQQYLKIASELPQADLLREELRQFEGRSRRGGSMDYGAGAGHDDLVMAGWWAYENRARALSGPEVKLLD